MSKLENLEVDRADAVTDPAIRKGFLILKSADPGELQANLAKLAEVCASVLMSLDPQMSYPEAAVGALNKLASTLQMPAAFKAFPPQNPNQPQPGDPLSPEDQPVDPNKPKKEPPPMLKSEDIVAIVEKAIEAGLAKYLVAPNAKSEDSAASPVQQPVSKQVAPTQSVKQPTKKLGEGLFKNVIFGR